MLAAALFAGDISERFSHPKWWSLQKDQSALVRNVQDSGLAFGTHTTPIGCPWMQLTAVHGLFGWIHQISGLSGELLSSYAIAGLRRTWWVWRGELEDDWRWKMIWLIDMMCSAEELISFMFNIFHRVYIDSDSWKTLKVVTCRFERDLSVLYNQILVFLKDTSLVGCHTDDLTPMYNRTTDTHDCQQNPPVGVTGNSKNSMGQRYDGTKAATVHGRRRRCVWRLLHPAWRDGRKVRMAEFIWVTVRSVSDPGLWIEQIIVLVYDMPFMIISCCPSWNECRNWWYITCL